MTSRSFMRLAEISAKKKYFAAHTPPWPKSHIHWPPTISLEQPLGAIWDSYAVSWAVVLVLPQIKLNSQLSYCEFISKLTGWSFSAVGRAHEHHLRPAWLGSSSGHPGLPWGHRGKEPACQCRWLGFSPCVGKIPWRRAWQPTPVLLPGEYHGQRSLAGCNPRGCRVRHDWACTHSWAPSWIWERGPFPSEVQSGEGIQAAAN